MSAEYFTVTKLRVGDIGDVDSLDWRTQNGVTPVKNQGLCGSCWVFATTAAFESFFLIKGKRAFDFSEEYVLECTGGNNNCAGGNLQDAYSRILQAGSILSIQGVSH